MKALTLDEICSIVNNEVFWEVIENQRETVNAVVLLFYSDGLRDEDKVPVDDVGILEVENK